MSKLALAAAALCAAFAVTTAAEAQSRRSQPLTVKVQPRSYFDAGRVPLPGGYSGHLSHVTFMATPVWSNVGERFGEGVLPPRVGAGPNPFGRF